MPLYYCWSYICWFLDFIHFPLISVRYMNLTWKCLSHSPNHIENAPMTAIFKTWQLDCLALKKLQITQVLLKYLKYNTIQQQILVEEVSVCIFFNLGFNFHLEFHQYKFRSLPWFFSNFCLNKLKLLYCLNQGFI